MTLGPHPAPARLSQARQLDLAVCFCWCFLFQFQFHVLHWAPELGLYCSNCDRAEELLAKNTTLRFPLTRASEAYKWLFTSSSSCSSPAPVLFPCLCPTFLLHPQPSLPPPLHPQGAAQWDTCTSPWVLLLFLCCSSLARCRLLQDLTPQDFGCGTVTPSIC